MINHSVNFRHQYAIPQVRAANGERSVFTKKYLDLYCYVEKGVKLNSLGIISRIDKK